eukprot:gene22897-30073_t
MVMILRLPSPPITVAFPRCGATSVRCVCHGIPDDRPLVEGDIVNVDVTVYLDGHHGDTSSMFFVGRFSEVSPEAKKPADVTKMSLDEAIKICAPELRISKIGDVPIQAKSVADYAQHFRNNVPGVMKLWQTFTIEPMLVQVKNVNQVPGGVKLWQTFTIQPMLIQAKK